MPKVTQLAPDQADIEAIRGDDIDLAITVYDVNLSTVNITGATVTFQVRPAVGGSSSFVRTVGSGIALTDAANGLLTVTVAALNTSALAIGTYLYDCQVTLSSVVTTVLRGRYILVGDIA